MRVLHILILLLFVTSFAKAQACGYTFLTIHLTDSNSQIVKNAEIKTFDKDFKKQDFLHYSGKTFSYDSRKKDISWSEDNQVYFVTEGMCGGHRDVGLRIKAENYETFEKVIDLPLGWTAYSIKLKRNDSDEIAEIIELTRIKGKILNLAGVGISKSQITAVSKEKTIFKTHTYSNGFYDLYLPVGEFNLKISAEGFKDITRDLIIADSKTVEIDLTLENRDVTTHPLITENRNNQEEK